MDIKQIIDILQEFNDYRRSQGKFADEDKTIKDLQYSAKEIGDAIDEAIKHLTSQKKFMDDLMKDLFWGKSFVEKGIVDCKQKISPIQDYTGVLKHNENINI